MGDYYKLKKVLLILIIVSSVLRIINTSRVFASEAVEVTPTWTDGNYTVQADNNYLSIQNSALNIQENVIDFFYFWKNNGSETYVTYLTNRLRDIFNVMSARYNRSSPIYITFSRPFDSNYNDVTFAYTMFGQGAINNGSIVFRDATLSDGYKLINQPFYTFSLSQYSYKEYLRNDNISTRVQFTSGSTYVACAEVGVYSPNWVDLFKYYGFIQNDTEYDEILTNIENNQHLSLQQEQLQTANMRDINQATTNTYNYIKDENVDEITSLGFSSPDVDEKIDLEDVFDQFETLLTDENYTPKQFSFWLPNGSETVFSISPTMLEDNLTRVGGSSIISIIHAIWFISLYGWYIFAYFGILGKLISGDWFHLVRGSSPVTNLVKMSVGSITGKGGF